MKEPRRPGAKLRRSRNEARDTLILDLVEKGNKYGAVAQALERGGHGRLSKQRISQIVNRQLEEVGQHRMEMAERIFDLKIEQLNMIIRTNVGVISAPCARCQGKGDMGQDPDRGPGTMMVCDSCRGDGRHHAPRDRAAASKEIRQAVDQQCKMLGLYAPEKFAFTDTDGNDLEFWHNETKGLDEDELTNTLQVYLDGVDAGRKEKKATEKMAE